MQFYDFLRADYDSLSEVNNQPLDEQLQLSRTFSRLMLRKYSSFVKHEAELDQLGRITGVDISPLYEMEVGLETNLLHIYLEEVDVNEKERLLKNAEREKAVEKQVIKGNINKVLYTINTLLDRLREIEELPNLLVVTNFDILSNEVYFSDFNTDKKKGHSRDNFGQDLRNFKRFLEYAKRKGAMTVWFEYR